jgi:hypothetical protein
LWRNQRVALWSFAQRGPRSLRGSVSNDEPEFFICYSDATPDDLHLIADVVAINGGIRFGGALICGEPTGTDR